MRRIPTTQYAIFLVAVIAALGGVALAKGGLYVDRHEGDVAHVVDIVQRMARYSQVPHLDFSTPLGVLAFLPIALLAKAGVGIGTAFILAQIIVAALLAPVVLRVAMSRLGGLGAWAFGFIAMALVLALVHGETVLSLSVSMYYNRWAWAITFAALFLAIMPAAEGTERPRLDGVYVGVLLAALALIKPTYFVAFVVPVVFGLVTRGAWRSLLAGLVAGGVVAAAVAAAYGVDFYVAYVGDLLSVAQSPTRSAPGADLVEILNGPRFLIATLTLILSVIVLRQGGQARAGLLLLLLAPAFVYVTYQNYGNDPKWLLFLGLYMMAHRPVLGTRVIFNADARNATAALALVSFALIAPSLQNIVSSPVRHFGETEDDYQLQVAGNPMTRDIWVYKDRVAVMLERTVMSDRIPALAPYGIENEALEPVSFLGEDLPRCSLHAGDAAVHAYMGDKLKEAPFNFPPETQFFVADIASVIWMVGGFTPLEGGAPWYYSGTPGIANADAILVPLCPIDTAIQRASLAALEGAGLVLRQPIRDEVMLVYPIKK